MPPGVGPAARSSCSTPGSGASAPAAAPRRWTGLVLALSLAGCGSSTAALEAEVARLRQELYRTRELAERAESKAANLKTRVDLLVASAEARSAPASAPAALEPRADAPSRPTRELPVVRIGQERRRADESDGALDEGEPPVMIRIRGKREERLSVDHDVLSRPDPVLDAPDDPERAYRVALATLRERKDPKGALTRFRAFLAERPEHRFADNALYWSGECLQILLEHEEALETFERLLALHPRSNKVPWAMLRAGESHLALGRQERGRALLERLRDDHPGTEPAKLAGARLEARAAIDR